VSLATLDGDTRLARRISKPHGWWHSGFVKVAGFALAITGVAKVASAVGSAHMLAMYDPVIGIRFRALLYVAGFLELAVATICLATRMHILSLCLVAWLAMGILLYRIALWASGWKGPCKCLGNLTDAIHISPNIADSSMKVILACLLSGSMILLLRLRDTPLGASARRAFQTQT
jgi:hypothetical protein